MIEKSKIRKRLVFWNDCEAIVQIPNSKILLKIPAGLMQIEEFENNNLVTCSFIAKRCLVLKLFLLLITLRNIQQKFSRDFYQNTT